MGHEPKKEWYWPLGALSYASEVHDYFSEEAELLGAITMLWTRQELALRHIFVELLEGKTAYAEAIWDRQTTHQQRRELLALALEVGELNERKREILVWVLDHTKTLADRRNELIHAEYVVHGRTDQLHAKVRSPRSNKPPRHQIVSAKDLSTVIESLERLLAATEAAWIELLPEQKRATFDAMLDDVGRGGRPPHNSGN